MESLEKVLANLELGSHLCCVYGDREESLSQISLFVSTGLERGEKCLYVVDDRDREDIVEFMKEQGVDVGEYLESGQLEFLTGKESYLKDGYFDPDEMIELIESEEGKALDEGYEGLRITGEMTWVLSDLPGSERLMEYEMNLNEFLPGSKSIGLCQYNEDKFSPETLIDVIYVHPKVLLEDSIYDNPYFMPPDLFLDRLQGKVSREHYDRMKGEIREKSELEKRQRLFSVSLEKSSPEVYWVSPEGKFVYANETAKERLGYSEEELKELHVWDIDPDYPKEKRKEFWKELKEKKVRTLEMIHETKDGVSYPVEMTSHYLEFGWGEYEFAFARDITERKKKEEELQEGEEKFRGYVENSPVGIFVLDLEGNLVEVNETVCELMGYSEEELLEMSVMDYIPPEAEEKGRKAFNEVLETGSVRVELPYIPKDGSKRFWIVNSVKISNDRLIAFAEDITERKKVEERKDFLNTLLRQDLRSKYQTIQGYHQLLEEEADIPEEQREYLEKAVKAGREVDEILGLAKKLREIEETDLVGENDIVKVLDHVTDGISTVAEREGVQIEKTYPDTIGKVEGDYSLNILFSQILLTRVQTSECDTIKLDAKERDEDVLVRIEDNGEQLPEDIASMFSGEPYTGETTGVGGVRYYIVRQIAEHNNAKIGVEGSELGGARFDIHLKKV